MREAQEADALPFSAHGLHFREWRLEDVDAMTSLFDTEQMNRWTPLPSPFSADVAREYVLRAQQGRDGGTLQMAVCPQVDLPPVGEVILFPGGVVDEVEVAYAVGAGYQGQGIATRALLAALDLARARGARRAALTIAEGNDASAGVAIAAGFRVADSPMRERQRKGFVLQMRTWTRDL